MKGQAMPRRPRAESICVLTLHPGSWLLEIPWVLGSGSWVLDDGSWPWLLAPGLWGPRYHIVVPESQVLCIMSLLITSHLLLTWSCCPFRQLDRGSGTLRWLQLHPRMCLDPQGAAGVITPHHHTSPLKKPGL